jgi:fluoride exporter
VAGNYSLSLIGTAAVATGAAFGGVLRWLLGIACSQFSSALPIGTLVANLLGGYLAGLAAGWFLLHPSVSGEWRLLVLTGLLGGFTTFSAFSLEVTALLQQQRWSLAALGMAAHVGGSLIMTALGFATIRWLKNPL